MTKAKHNDSEREQWIANDEGLYKEQKRSGLSMRDFIRTNREAIDELIDNVVSGKKPAHYKEYGG